MEELLPVSDAFSSHWHLPTTLWLHCESWLWSSTPTVAFRLRAFKIERTLRWKTQIPLRTHYCTYSFVSCPTSTSNVVYFDQMHSLSVPVWLIIGKKLAVNMQKMVGSYHRGTCRVYTLQLSSCHLSRRDKLVRTIELKWIANHIVSCSPDR